MKTATDIVLMRMAAGPRPKVKPVATPQGYFVSAAIQEQTLYFLALAAKRKGPR